MATETETYVKFLAKVEDALTDALKSGEIPADDEQREELEWMRTEVARTRRALIDRQVEEALPVAAAR